MCVCLIKKKKRLNIFKNQIQNRNAEETVDRSVQESCFYGRMGLKIVLRERLGLAPTSLLENRECAEGSLITQRKGALKICLFGEVAGCRHSLTTRTWPRCVLTWWRILDSLPPTRNKTSSLQIYETWLWTGVLRGRKQVMANPWRGEGECRERT